MAGRCGAWPLAIQPRASGESIRTRGWSVAASGRLSRRWRASPTSSVYGTAGTQRRGRPVAERTWSSAIRTRSVSGESPVIGEPPPRRVLETRPRPVVQYAQPRSRADLIRSRVAGAALPSKRVDSGRASQRMSAELFRPPRMESSATRPSRATIHRQPMPSSGTARAGALSSETARTGSRARVRGAPDVRERLLDDPICGTSTAAGRAATACGLESDGEPAGAGAVTARRSRGGTDQAKLRHAGRGQGVRPGRRIVRDSARIDIVSTRPTTGRGGARGAAGGGARAATTVEGSAAARVWPSPSCKSRRGGAALSRAANSRSANAAGRGSSRHSVGGPRRPMRQRRSCQQPVIGAVVKSFVTERGPSRRWPMDSPRIVRQAGRGMGPATGVPEAARLRACHQARARSPA